MSCSVPGKLWGSLKVFHGGTPCSIHLLHFLVGLFYLWASYSSIKPTTQIIPLKSQDSRLSQGWYRTGDVQEVMCSASLAQGHGFNRPSGISMDVVERPEYRPSFCSVMPCLTPVYCDLSPSCSFPFCKDSSTLSAVSELRNGIFPFSAPIALSAPLCRAPVHIMLHSSLDMPGSPSGFTSVQTGTQSFPLGYHWQRCTSSAMCQSQTGGMLITSIHPLFLTPASVSGRTGPQQYRGASTSLCTLSLSPSAGARCVWGRYIGQVHC